MNNYLLILLPFLFTSLLSLPFISFLYKIRLQTSNVREEDGFGKKEMFNKLHAHKSGTPTGGGVLIMGSAFLLFVLLGYLQNTLMDYDSLAIIITIVLFWLIGLYDDSQKLFKIEKKGLFGIRIRYKFMIQILAAFIVSYFLYMNGMNSISLPIVGNIHLGAVFVLYSTLLITFLANCFNITDGLDGLSAGIYLIICTALLASVQNSNLLNYLYISFGCVLAYLYFNIKPARYYYGDTGALPIGACLGVISLISGNSILALILYSLIILEGLSSLAQVASKKLRNGKKILLIAPLHHHFEALGWEESKVVSRFWLAQVVLAILFLALIGYF